MVLSTVDRGRDSQSLVVACTREIATVMQFFERSLMILFPRVELISRIIWLRKLTTRQFLVRPK